MILRGNPVSPGVAVGKVYVYQPFHVQVTMSVFPAELVEEQLERYDRARCNAARELQSLYREIHSRDREQAGIFDAHRQIMEDEELDGGIRMAILEECLSPDWAIYKVYGEYIALFQDAADAVTRERADDLKDLRTRLLRNWYGIGEVNLSRLSEPLVVVAHDLLPSDTATLDRQKVLGILTERGGGTSHAAIIARSYGIPAVMGIDGLLSAVAPNAQVAVDALAGEVTLFPSREQIREAEEKRSCFLGERAKTSEYLLAPSRMADGVRIEIGLNLNSDSDEELAAASAVDSVGLTRTEFLYSGRIADEQSQFQVYKRILETFGDKPVTLRTLDIGGDKPIDGIPGAGESNPFLGNRGIRFCFDHPQLLRTQFRAALRASMYGRLRLMLPMISAVEEIVRAKEILEDVREELLGEGVSVSDRVELGIMIETPSIALLSDKAASLVDFASIGTNDLCQYLLAVDRLNPHVSGYYQMYHPALFRLIGEICREYDSAGIPLSVCGELAGDSLAVPLLVGLGVRRLSVASSAIASVKRTISRISMEEVRRLAERAASCSTAEEVRAWLNKLY